MKLDIWYKLHRFDVQHYHMYNDIFRSKGWRSACNLNGKGLSLSGLNSHHQNGITECRIRDIQDGTNTALNHTHCIWSLAITDNLWPYAAKMYHDMVNHTPNISFKDGRTPMEAFGNTTVTIDMRGW